MGLVGGVAVEQAVPFGRVWSFPTEIKIAAAEETAAIAAPFVGNTLLTTAFITREHLEVLRRNLRFTDMFGNEIETAILRPGEIGPSLGFDYIEEEEL